MKLCNFASLDPALKLRGIKGLVGASALDRAVWNEFHADLNEAVPASEGALRMLFGADEGSELEVLPKEGVRVRKRPPMDQPNDCKREAPARSGVFSAMLVLNNFGGRCGVTELAVRELLIASHILPWGTHVAGAAEMSATVFASRVSRCRFRDRAFVRLD